MGVIYLLKDKDNSMPYVGQTVGTFDKRMKKHLRGNQYVDNVLRSKGTENFEIIMEDNIPEDFLDFIEIGMIQSYDSVYPNGYNLELGGNTHKHPNEKTREKMRESHKEQASLLRGVPRTNDIKKKISEGNKGKIVSEETKQKIREARAKQVFSEETIKKMSESRKGKPSYWLGKTHSEEYRKKQSERIKKWWVDRKEKI